MPQSPCRRVVAATPADPGRAGRGATLSAVNSEYRIRRYDASGQLTGIVTRPTEARMVPESDEQLLIDAAIEIGDFEVEASFTDDRDVLLG